MSSSDIHQIRRARATDVTDVGACVAAAYSHYVSRIGQPPRPMLDDYAELIRRQTVFVLTERQRVIGIIVLIREEQSLLLDNVAVRPDYQGRGLGRKLIGFAEAEAVRLELNAVTLYTHEQMTENIEIYKKLGFNEIERKTEQGYKRVYMRKLLSIGPG
jgi:ribosomal protein S18 acetylase RimI-like enzyme